MFASVCFVAMGPTTQQDQPINDTYMIRPSGRLCLTGNHIFPDKLQFYGNTWRIPVIESHPYIYPRYHRHPMMRKHVLPFCAPPWSTWTQDKSSICDHVRIILYISYNSVSHPQWSISSSGWWYSYFPLKNMKVSWDNDIPTIWRVKKIMFQTTNQSSILRFCVLSQIDQYLYQ